MKGRGVRVPHPLNSKDTEQKQAEGKEPPSLGSGGPSLTASGLTVRARRRGKKEATKDEHVGEQKNGAGIRAAAARIGQGVRGFQDLPGLGPERSLVAVASKVGSTVRSLSGGRAIRLAGAGAGVHGAPGGSRTTGDSRQAWRKPSSGIKNMRPCGGKLGGKRRRPSRWAAGAGGMAVKGRLPGWEGMARDAGTGVQVEAVRRRDAQRDQGNGIRTSVARCRWSGGGHPEAYGLPANAPVVDVQRWEARGQRAEVRGQKRRAAECPPYAGGKP